MFVIILMIISGVVLITLIFVRDTLAFERRLNHSHDPFAQSRTDPCIALYPTMNANGSCRLFNLRSKARVSRTNFKLMRTTPEIIVKIMTNMSSSTGATIVSDFDKGMDVPNEVDEDIAPTPTQTPRHIEIIEEEDDPIPPESITGHEPQEAEEVQDEAEPIEQSILLRRLARSSAGVTNSYDDHTRIR